MHGYILAENPYVIEVLVDTGPVYDQRSQDIHNSKFLKMEKGQKESLHKNIELPKYAGVV